MSLHKRSTKIATALPPCDDFTRDVWTACAEHMQPYSRHSAGGGSYYVYAGDVKIRFADHENTSAYYDEPDFNFIGGCTTNDLKEIVAAVKAEGYPRIAKKTVVAKHLGLTTPKLKKLLADHPEAYEEVCENEYYSNTYTEYVAVAVALRIATEAGFTARVPVFFGQDCEEDYSVEY